jgi:pimeloyl-ACP methyl ester carboxylesterase/NTP pyrophosphatase (non-canonical NTP hydrolase)
MTFAELQARVDAWIGQFQEGYWPPLANLARLVEEVGELSRELNHRFGPKKKKGGEGDGDLALELADIVFVLAALANSLGVDLEEAMRRTMEKYAARDAARWLRKDGEAGAMRVERVRFSSTGGYDLAGLWTDPPRGDGSAPAARAAIVCAHGMLSSKESDKFQALAERMWREGVACLRFDMSGRGESGGDPSRILYSQETLDVASAVAFVRARGRSEVALCGSSMGGAVSVLYAALDASVRAVATLAAVSRPGHFARQMPEPERARTLARGYFEYDGVRIHADYLEDAEASDVLEAAARLATSGRALLVLHGDADTVVPVEDGRLLAGAGRGRLVTVEGADHRFSREADFERVLGHLVDFFLQTWLGAPARAL